MMDIIQKTGVPIKNKGDGLSSSDVNKINGTVNLNVEANNLYLRSIFDVNLELGTDQSYTLAEAIGLVPIGRRELGFKIRYINYSNFYEEKNFMGNDINDWNDLNKWGRNDFIIDGGEY